MKTPVLVLLLTCASVVLGSAAVWLLRHDVAPAVAAEQATSGNASASGRAQAARPEAAGREPGSARTPLEHEPGEPLAEQEPEAPADLFPWRMRDPPQVEGPVIESSYASGTPEFLGSQVLSADGEWLRDGAWTAWYENGQVCERGAYRAGVEHGPWQWFYEDGTPMAQGSWVGGERVGEWTFWHESGALGTVASYVDGAGSGVWTLYHESGWKWAEGPWANGAPNGHWNVWNEDGTLDLERTGTYVDGTKVD